MKKALVVVLALVMTLSVVGLVSCAGKTYEGEYSYSNWGNTYGCKVKVSVQGNVITNVEIMEAEMEEAGWHNLSPNWTNNPYGGAIEGEAGVDTAGKTNWLKFGQAMVDSFTGLTTQEVLGMKVYVATNGEPITGKTNVETIKYIPDSLEVVIGGHGEFAKDAGATQSSARLVLAVQDALLQAKGDVSKNKNCVTIDYGTSATAYGLVHRQGYVGIATITVKYGKIAIAELDEACFPTQVKANAEAGTHAVEVSGTYYWKTVKYDNVTMVYDATDGYKVGDKTLKQFFADAAACEAYAKAVLDNRVSVETADGFKTDIMTSAALLKSQNGYWETPAANALGWTANVEATCKYVVANGFDGITAADDLKHKDGYDSEADKIVTGQPIPDKMYNEWLDKNGVATGATWTDMWDYVNLLHTAYNKISK